MGRKIILGIATAFLGLVLIGLAAPIDWIVTLKPILPPFFAITFALASHEVFFSLFVGIVLGSILTLDTTTFSALPIAAGRGLFKALDGYVLSALNDSAQLQIILFTFIIGGTVGVVVHSGGLRGVATYIAKRVHNPVLAQIATWAMGIFIFFDDYANCLIVGNTMRPISDKFRVSREKLSFIVDATAAPVSSIVLISTWIGYELGMIQDAFTSAQINTIDPYWAFIQSIPFRFYPLLLLLFIPIYIFMRREWGTMHTAETRARQTGEVIRKDAIPMGGDDKASAYAGDFRRESHPVNAILPIGVLIGGVLVGLWITGTAALAKEGVAAPSFKDIINQSDSFSALLWAALASSIVAILMTILQKISDLKDTMMAWTEGVKSMVIAVITLTLAWALGGVTKDLKTAEFVAQLISGSFAVQWMPVIVFIVSAAISFATGTSWGTMAIVFPVAIPVVVQLASGDSDLAMYLNATIGSILSGAIFGDHCSPISDTTIMASMASGSDHIDHVSTQLPYAFLIGFIAIIVGYIPAGYGFNPYLSNCIGLLLCIGIFYYLGKKPISEKRA